MASIFRLSVSVGLQKDGFDALEATWGVSIVAAWDFHSTFSGSHMPIHATIIIITSIISIIQSGPVAGTGGGKC